VKEKLNHEYHEGLQDRINKKTFLQYTLLFIVMTLIGYAYFILSGRSFVWWHDGYGQHYIFLAYFTEMVRAFIFNPAMGIPLWVNHSGMGANLIADFAYYIDPFDYLAVSVPRAYLVYAYNCLAILRLFTAGLAFLLLARQLKIKNSGALVGVITYVFSMFPVSVSTRHPFFIDGMIMLPLMFFGIEKILRQKSYWWLILFSWLSAIMNFYFFYITIVFSGVYFLVRFFTLYGWRGQLQGFLRRFGILVSSCAAGMMLAGPILFPTIWGFLHSARTGGMFANGMLLFPLSYYLALPRIFLTGETYLWTTMGYAAIALFVIPFLIFRHRQYKSNLVMLLIFTLVMLLPPLSAIMNGFTVPSNRWTFGLNLIISVAVARLIAERSSFSQKEYFWFLVTIVIYIPLAFIGGGTETLPSIAFFMIIDVFFALLGWALLFRSTRRMYILLLTSVCLNLAIAANMYFANINPHLQSLTALASSPGFYHGEVIPKVVNLSSHMLRSSGKTWLENQEVELKLKNTFNGAEKVIKKADSGIYRIGHTSMMSGPSIGRNQSLLLNYYTTDYFLSINNGDVAKLSKSLENRQYTVNKPLEALDDRLELNHYFGVKYIIASGNQPVPSSYKKFRQTGRFTIYRTSEALPFSYLQTNYLSNSQFSRHHPVQKGLDLLNAAILNEKDTKGLSRSKSTLHIKNVPFHMSTSNGVENVDNLFKVTKRAPINLALDQSQLKRNDELYVRISGLRQVSNPPQTVGDVLRQGVVRQSRAFSLDSRFQDGTKSNTQTDILDFSNYEPHPNMTFNLGSYQSSQQNIQLFFGSPGTYTYDRIQVLAVPYDRAYRTQIHKLQKNPLHITSYKDGYLSGRIRNKQTGILVTQLPYSSGWSATVDGRPMQTLRVDQAFVGLKLSAGDHRIILRYWTPWLTAGLIAMMFTAAGLVALAVVSRKKKGGTQH
jgi:uncharacterized membrane protein YfhO